jgi:hypothetical protein
MRKSFTRLFGLVMFLTLLSSVSMAAINVVVWPNDDGGEAYSKPTDKIMIIFPEAVKAGTGYVRLYAGTSLERSITATDARISYAMGDTVVIDFTADQEELVTYKVEVVDGTFKPVATASAASVAYVPTWYFTVGDYTAPTLTDVLPVKDATVGQTISLELTFEDKSPIELGTGKIAVYKEDGNVWDLIDVAHPGTHTVVLLDGVLTVTGIRGLEDLTDYAVTVGAGVVTDNGLNVDEEKNAYAGLTDRAVWTFSSKDFSVPGFATGYPKVGTVGTTTADILVKATETGTAYAMFLPAGSTAPSVTAIKTANNKVTIAVANTEYKISLTGMGVATSSADFDVYVVTENTDVAASSTDIKMLEVTTTENVKPSMVTIGYVKGDVISSYAITANPTVDQATTKLVFNFDEDVLVGAGSILIYNKSDNTVFATVDASAITIDDAGDAVAVLPKVFVNHANYYAFIPSTLFKDKFDNFYAGVTTTTGWTFSTNDIIAPTVVSYTPAQGAVGVAVDANIVVKFSEVMDIPASGDVAADAVTPAFLVEVDGTPVAYSYAHSTNNNVFSTVTITTDADFASSGVVTVTVNGNVADLNGNVLGLTQGNSFIAEDIVGPTIEFVTASPIAPSASIVVKFDEPIRLLGGTALTASNLYTIITLKNSDISGTADGTNVSATYAISDDKTTITITPASPWTSKGYYYVAISSDVEDASGNKNEDLAVDRSKVYTVNDVIAAVVAIDKDGKTDVGVTDNITFTFKEGATLDAVAQLFYEGSWHTYSSAADLAKVIVFKEGDANGANVAFTVSSSATGTFVVDPTATLTGAKTYYIGIGASTKDAGGNVNAAKYASFTTLFVTAPELVSLAPANEAIEVALTTTPVLTFNTDISKIAEGSYTSPVTLNGASVAYADLVVSGKTLTIKHSTAFVKTTDYEVIIPSGVIVNKNATSAAYAGIAAGEWIFSTVDQTFDLAFTLTPDGLVTPELSDKLVMTFPEKVVVGTGNIAIKNAATDLLIEQIASTSSQVAFAYDGDETTVTITPSANFVYGTGYYVEVDNGAFVDAYANKIPAIHGKTSDGYGNGSWTFTAVDTDLVITKVTPYLTENNAVDVDIVVEFNRDIVKGTSGNIGFIETNFAGDVTKQTVSYGITSSNLTISGNKLTIKHADKPFTNNSTIFVTIESGAIKAATKTSSTVVLVQADAKKFYVGDNLAPVATVTPTWDPETENYSQVNTNVTITFNEDVLNAVTGVALTNNNVTYNEIATDDVVQLLDASLARVDFQGTISGRTITIDPTSNLSQSTTYTVRIVGGKIKDTHSHTITSDVISIFKTVDTTIPTASVTLTGGAKAVTISAITVTDANPKYFYYVLKKKSEAALTTVAEVKAGTKKETPVSNITISDLDASTAYVLYYVAEDAFGNVTAVKTAEATTIDTVAPLFVSADPANGTLNVANDKLIVLTFNEAVQINTSATGSIYIKDKATNTIISVLDVDALDIVADSDSKKVSITTGFASNLDAVQVYVELDGGLISDKATPTANVFAGILGTDKLYFTYEDNKAPTLADWTGSDGEPIALSSNIQLTFSEDIQAGTGNAILYGSDNVAIEVFKGSEVSISGKVVTINPTDNFDNNSSYWIDVLTGFVKDKSSNKNSNVATDAPNFNTADNVAPYILATSTPAASTNISKDQLDSFTFNFSEQVYLTIAGLKKSLSILTDADIKNNVTFKKADGTAVTFAISSKFANSFSFTTAPDAIADETSYVITIGGFMDIDGLVMQTETFNYTTDDGKAPVITFNPADKATDVLSSAALTMTFSESIYHSYDTDNGFYEIFDNTNIDDVVYLSDNTAEESVAFDATFNGTNKITITPTKALISGHEYVYGLINVDGVVTDVSGNELIGGADGTTATFTVKDSDKPTFTIEAEMVSPEPGATSVPADENMWITFSEDIVVGTGSIAIRYEDGTLFETISGASLSVVTDTLKIAHKDFDSSATYFVEIGAGVITDKAGNGNAAMTDPTKWTFTTKDTFELTATVTPVGDNTPRTVSLTLSFNKAPEGQANKFLSVYKEDGTAVYQKAVSEMSVVGNEAVYASVALDANQAYYARVEAGAFEDASGNSFAGIMDNSWAFSTVDNIAPKVVTLLPADDATGIDAQTSAFTITFDRDIAVGTGVISVRYGVSGSSFEDIDVTAATISGKTLTFNLTKTLDAETAFYVLVPAGTVTNTEVTADAFAGILNTYTWNFTTSTDQTAPALLTWTPTGTLTDNHPTFVMTFDEDVVLGSGSVKVYKASDNTLALTVPVTAAMVSGKTVTAAYVYDATLKNGLDQNTAYYVLVDAGVVKDAIGNGVVAITDVTKWTFTTGGFVTDITDPEKDSSLEFKVYPNPFVEYVTVSNASELSKVVVSNIAGQIVKEVVNPDGTIQLNELRSGAYFIALYQDDAVIKTVKILKR